MKRYSLHFGAISIVKEDIAEVILSDGIEINNKTVHEFHHFLKEHLKDSFSILVNKKHSYSYTFDAQKIIGSIKEIKAIGVINYTSGAEPSTQY